MLMNERAHVVNKNIDLQFLALQTIYEISGLAHKAEICRTSLEG